MKMNIGAQRQVMDEARAARLVTANELVQRTLSQHGLLPGQTQQQDRSVLDSMKRGFGFPNTNQAASKAPLPNGAEFRTGEIKSAEGSRTYRVYVPSTASKGVTGVVLMLHGCTQTAEDFAAGTAMNGLAEEYGFVAVYPQQSRGDNAQSCWNWFRRGDQRRGRGEPAILAELALKLMKEFDVPGERCFVAGLSAGAAMAVILGQTYGDVFAAVGAHSGLPYESAKDVPSAFAAMSGNAQASAVSLSEHKPVRTIVFHGRSDTTVRPSNGDAIASSAVNAAVGQLVEETTRDTAAGRSFSRTITSDMTGAVRSEHWVVEGLGHAWSGGQPGGSYTDPKGPDASAQMIRFFYDTLETN
jgi:poly(hydroxyalkanoate) depolymerase family esterase